MRFIKEISGILIILVFVITIEIITEKITHNSLKNLEIQISMIENRENDNNLKNIVYNLSKVWETEEKRLSCYMEHDELEEISKIVNAMMFSVDNNENKDIWEQIDEIKFKMEHIEDKQKIKIENIF